MLHAPRHLLATLLTATLVLWVGAPALAAPKDAKTAPAAKETAPAKPAAAKSASRRTGFRAIKRRSNLTEELARKGEEELQRSVRVFQQRYLIKKFRVELVVGGSTELGDALVNHLVADAGLTFHLSQRWAIGVSGLKAWGERQDSFTAVQDDFGLFPERSMMQAAGLAEVQFSPVFGKFSSFGLAVVQMDAYLIAGGGLVRTTTVEDLKPAGLIGFGLRIHTLRAMTLSLEIRDLLFTEGFVARDSLLQHVFGGVKIGFWSPPSFSYRFQR